MHSITVTLYSDHISRAPSPPLTIPAHTHLHTLNCRSNKIYELCIILLSITYNPACPVCPAYQTHKMITMMIFSITPP